jgi:hypothetical protein
METHERNDERNDARQRNYPEYSTRADLHQTTSESLRMFSTPVLIVQSDYGESTAVGAGM